MSQTTLQQVLQVIFRALQHAIHGILFAGAWWQKTAHAPLVRILLLIAGTVNQYGREVDGIHTALVGPIVGSE